MKSFEGEYSGAALSSFINGLGESEQTIKRILEPHGLTTIDPDAWYDLDLARAIYYDIESHIGGNTLYNVGNTMIESAPFPPHINDVPSVLGSLDFAYKMNVRGPEIGGIETEIDEDEESAVITFSTPFPCHLERGIIAGCCKKFGATPLLEHGANGCRDQGAESCEYHLSW